MAPDTPLEDPIAGAPEATLKIPIPTASER